MKRICKVLVLFILTITMVVGSSYALNSNSYASASDVTVYDDGIFRYLELDESINERINEDKAPFKDSDGYWNVYTLYDSYKYVRTDEATEYGEWYSSKPEYTFDETNYIGDTIYVPEYKEKLRYGYYAEQTIEGSNGTTKNKVISWTDEPTSDMEIIYTNTYYSTRYVKYVWSPVSVESVKKFNTNYKIKISDEKIALFMSGGSEGNNDICYINLSDLARETADKVRIVRAWINSGLNYDSDGSFSDYLFSSFDEDSMYDFLLNYMSLNGNSSTETNFYENLKKLGSSIAYNTQNDFYQRIVGRFLLEGVGQFAVRPLSDNYADSTEYVYEYFSDMAYERTVEYLDKLIPEEIRTYLQEIYKVYYLFNNSVLANDFNDYVEKSLNGGTLANKFVYIELRNGGSNVNIDEYYYDFVDCYNAVLKADDDSYIYYGNFIDVLDFGFGNSTVVDPDEKTIKTFGATILNIKKAKCSSFVQEFLGDLGIKINYSSSLNSKWEEFENWYEESFNSGKFSYYEFDYDKSIHNTKDKYTYIIGDWDTHNIYLYNEISNNPIFFETKGGFYILPISEENSDEYWESVVLPYLKNAINNSNSVIVYSTPLTNDYLYNSDGTLTLFGRQVEFIKNNSSKEEFDNLTFGEYKKYEEADSVSYEVEYFLQRIDGYYDETTYEIHNFYGQSSVGLVDKTGFVTPDLDSGIVSRDSDGDIHIKYYFERENVQLTYIYNGKTIYTETIPYGGTLNSCSRLEAYNDKEIGSYKTGLFRTKFDKDKEITSDMKFYITLVESHTITYVQENLIFNKKVVVKYGEKTVEPEKPTKYQNEFECWCIDSERTTEFKFGDELDSDITLYAKFSPIECYVTLKVDGSEYDKIVVMTDECLDKDSIVEPKKAGYKFVCWTYGIFNKEYDFSTTIHGDFTLNAKFEKISNPVELISDGVSVDTVYVGLNEKLNEDELIEVTKEGYEFTGWYSDKACKKSFDFNSIIKRKTTIYAGFKKQVLTVTLHYGDILEKVEDISIEYGDKLSKLPESKRTGYQFLGWVNDKNESIDMNMEIKENITLYASFAPNTYTVVIETNGGTIDCENEILCVFSDGFIINNEQVDSIPDPYKENAGFEGWYYDTSFTMPYSGSSCILSNITIYAKYKEYKAFARLYVDGVLYDTVEVYQNMPISKDNLVEPEKDGYEFTGWYYDESLTNKFNYGDSINKDTRLYAGFEKKSFKVTFRYYLSGSGPVDLTTYVPYMECVPLSSIPTDYYDNNNYDCSTEFNGWFVTFNGTTKAIEYNSYMPITEDAYIVATYIDKYKVNFVDGTKTTTKYYSHKYVGEIYEPRKDGYTFSGWFFTSSYIKQTKFSYKDANFVTVSQDMTLYAKWSANKVNVRYVVDGSLYETYEGHYDEELTLLTPDKRDNYKFVGWSTENTSYYEGITTYDKVTLKEDVTYYAIFKPNTYLVTFAVPWNSSFAYASKSFDYGTTYGTIIANYEIPIDRNVYDFYGWYLDKDYKTSVNTNVIPEGDFMLFAKIAKKKVKITYMELNENDVYVEGMSLEVTINESPAGKVTPSRPGYSFAGWYKEDGTEYNYEPLSSNLIVYARYNLCIYEIEYKVAGDSNTYTSRGLYTSAINAPTIIEPIGYDFDGWYKDSGYTKKVDLTNKTYADSDIPSVLYGRYVKEKRTITFMSQNDDGGWYEYSKVTVDYGDVPTLPEKPTRAHCKFRYWTTDTSLTTVYTNGELLDDEIVYAYFKPETYTVTFINGDSRNTETVQYGGYATAPTITEPTGYDFDGWYTDSSYKTKFNVSTEKITKDITLYGRFVKEKRTITYMSKTEGGTWYEYHKDTLDYGTVPTLPSAPSLSHNTFVGWKADSSLNTAYTQVALTSNTIVYACFTPETHTVTFISPSGKNTETIQYGGYATEPTITEPTGYDFDGWYKDSSYTTKFNVSTEKITSDITLYGRFVKEKRTITYMSKTESGTWYEYHKDTLDYGTVPTLPGAPYLSHNTFVGWKADSSLNTAYTQVALTSNTIVYACFTPEMKTVSFSSGLSGVTVSSISVAYNGTITAPTPTNAAYNFLGWYDDSSLTHQHDFSSKVTTNYTLYGKWSIKTFTYVYILDGGTVNTQTYNYGANTTRPSDPTIPSGYDFFGWYTDSSCTTQYAFGSLVTSNRTLYGTKKQYINVKFDCQNGSTTYKKVYYGETVSQPSNPTKTGCTFTGWYTTSKCLVKYDFTTPVTGALTLYAGWDDGRGVVKD